ncbi:MAG: hypothetical protein KatS3mg102_1065 [Planctomycetota bacterium]|nr:MAG: hypothetical protein KatS3mg102_1065 [Planctomycetota bacterium]
MLEAAEPPPADGTPFYWKVEFLGKREIEATLHQLQSRGLSLQHYFPPAEDAAGAGAGPPPYRIEHPQAGRFELRSLREIPETVRRIGQRGLEIQRYKGLGEMNPEQLWETTMDPARRSLIRIRLVDAARADHMFSVLMGSSVELRRAFLERHALDVKDLDV